MYHFIAAYDNQLHPLVPANFNAAMRARCLAATTGILPYKAKRTCGHAAYAVPAVLCQPR